MNQSKLVFAILFMVTAILFAVFEYGLLPLASFPNNPQSIYIIDAISALLAVGGCFLLLYFFRIPAIRRLTIHSNGFISENKMNRLSIVRLIIWFVMMLTLIVFYYEAPFATNPKYCILILFIAGVFCWPSSNK